MVHAYDVGYSMGTVVMGDYFRGMCAHACIYRITQCISYKGLMQI